MHSYRAMQDADTLYNHVKNEHGIAEPEIQIELMDAEHRKMHEIAPEPKPTHTAGPWWSEERGGGWETLILLGNAPRNTIVCDPYGPNPQDKALIEASPYLLEALERIAEPDDTDSAHDHIAQSHNAVGKEHDQHHEQIDALREIARDAIAKVKGEV